MKVVLLKNIQGTGQAGEIKEVSDGHALNYLFPRKLARPAKDSDLNRKSTKSFAAVRADKKQSAFKKMRGRVDGTKLSFEAKADEKGHLYGSVGPDDISARLKEKGFDVKESMVKTNPIKSIGTHKIDIDFGSAGQARIVVEITKEKE